MYHLEQLDAVLYDLKQVHACYAAAGLAQFLITAHVFIVHAVISHGSIFTKHTWLSMLIVVHVVIDLIEIHSSLGQAAGNPRFNLIFLADHFQHVHAVLGVAIEFAACHAGLIIMMLHVFFVEGLCYPAGHLFVHLVCFTANFKLILVSSFGCSKCSTEFIAFVCDFLTGNFLYLATALQEVLYCISCCCSKFVLSRPIARSPVNPVQLTISVHLVVSPATSCSVHRPNRWHLI